jgi:hypothetical protein
MRRTLAVAITAVLTLVGCGGGSDTQDQAGSAANTEAAGSNTGSDTGSASSGAEQAPSLVVDKIGGGQIDIADLLGQDVVLWFWAPW